MSIGIKIKKTIDSYKQWLKCDFFIKNLFWRNTKEHAKESDDDFSIPDYEYDTLYLDFHPVEKTMYDDMFKSEDKKFLVSGFSDSFCGKKSLRNLLSDQIAALENREERLNEHELTHPHLFSEEERNQVRLRLQTMRKVYKKYYPDGDSTIDPKIEAYGTKVANTLGFILTLMKNDDTARILIFSSLNHTLKRVAQVLEANDISSTMLVGNVNTKGKAIRDFKKGVAKVMLLNLGKSDSGTNLIAASHIIVVDPVTKYNYASYEQALGRAHRVGQNKSIKIVHFIVNKTFEYDVYQEIKVKNEEKQKKKRTKSKLCRSGSLVSL